MGQYALSNLFNLISFSQINACYPVVIWLVIGERLNWHIDRFTDDSALKKPSFSDVCWAFSSVKTTLEPVAKEKTAC